MIEFKIKGVPTQYTPQYRSRYIYDRTELPLTDSELPVLNSNKPCWVNGRKCVISCHTSWLNGKDDEVYYTIATQDKPKAPRKPRLREQMADEVFIDFCRTRNWLNLLYAYERHWGSMFRDRLIENLKSLTDKPSCEDCKLKFKCFTEK